MKVQLTSSFSNAVNVELFRETSLQNCVSYIQVYISHTLWICLPADVQVSAYRYIIFSFLLRLLATLRAQK